MEPLGATPAITTTGMMTFTQTSYQTLVDGGSWRIYQLPDYPLPWGIAAGDALWFVDSLRQVLGGVPIEEKHKV